MIYHSHFSVQTSSILLQTPLALSLIFKTVLFLGVLLLRVLLPRTYNRKQRRRRGGKVLYERYPCLRIHFTHLPLISLSLSHFVTFLLLAVLLQVLLRDRYHPARPPLRPLAPPSPSLRRLPPAVLLLVLQLLVLLLDLLLCKFECEGKFDGKEGRGLGQVRVQV